MPLLLLLALAFPAQAVPNRAETTAVETAPVRREVRFSKHALERMAERGVGRETVLRIVRAAEPFRYFHQGRWKTGYYDEAARIFVASADGIVITVFTDATPGYVARLKRAKPGKR